MYQRGKKHKLFFFLCVLNIIYMIFLDEMYMGPSDYRSEKRKCQALSVEYMNAFYVAVARRTFVQFVNTICVSLVKKHMNKISRQ